ncbi:MAG: BspA family leucine-rich repeat surface protein [Allomuricauda sp.]
MKQKILLLLTLAVLTVFSCSKDDGPSTSKNSTPVIKAQTFTVQEDISDTAVIGTVVATDADKDKLTFSIKTDSSNLFEITTAGALSLASGKTLDFAIAHSHSIVVSVSDGTASDNATITINVTEVDPDVDNHAPVIAAQTFGVSEDITDADLIGTVIATDIDEDTLSIFLGEGESDLFRVFSTGELRLKDGAVLDFETTQQYVITVSVSDGNDIAQANITINVTDVNEAPTFDSTTLSYEVEENSQEPAVGTVVANDSENDDLTFTLTDDANELFAITEGGALSLAAPLNYEFQQAYSLTVEVTDGTNDPVSAEITITVLNLMDTLAEDPTSFVTKWTTTVDNDYVEVGVRANFTYDYTIEWGDGSSEDITNSVNPKHMYAKAGTYTVAIKGAKFPAIRMSEVALAGDRAKLVSIERWGNNPWATMHRAFFDCEVVQYKATDSPNLSQVTDMSFMFVATFDLGSPDLNSWDVSTVTNMSNMFEGSSFNGDIDGWVVSGVTNMASMFTNAISFNKDLSGWDVSKVADMSSMFTDAISFDQSLGAWDLSSITATGMLNMLDGSGFSFGNYDSTLTGWYLNNNTPDGIALGAQGLHYCNSLNLRSLMMMNKAWTFNGDIFGCN